MLLNLGLCRSGRCLVLVYTVLSILITVAFGADVNAQAGDGLAISGLFIAGIVVVSLVSRVLRTTELRADAIEFDDVARRFITESLTLDGRLNVIANQRQAGDVGEYLAKEAVQRGMNPLPGNADVRFLEVDVVDPSAFSQVLQVRGVEVGGHRLLRVDSPAVPNPIAAVLLALRDATGETPHAHFEWAEGNPLGHLFRYLPLGRGDTAPVVREILRKVEPVPQRRPVIHVGG